VTSFPTGRRARASIDFGSELEIARCVASGAARAPGPSRRGDADESEELLLEDVHEPKAAKASASDWEQLLAEASVYLRYGKRDKAIAQLQRVIEANPNHRGALEKLGEAHAESGDHAQAVQVWLRAALRAHAERDSEALRVLRGRIAVLDESAAAAAGRDTRAGARGCAHGACEQTCEGAARARAAAPARARSRARRRRRVLDDPRLDSERRRRSPASREIELDRRRGGDPARPLRAGLGDDPSELDSSASRSTLDGRGRPPAPTRTRRPSIRPRRLAGTRRASARPRASRCSTSPRKPTSHAAGLHDEAEGSTERARPSRSPAAPVRLARSPGPRWRRGGGAGATPAGPDIDLDAEGEPTQPESERERRGEIASTSP
jgi:hypothetical protein